MEAAQLNKRRQANEIPFKIFYWLQGLSPVGEQEKSVTYKGYALAEDAYGKYAAIIGTTDQLLKEASDAPLKVLQIRKRARSISGNY